jgi:hypothetical protein
MRHASVAGWISNMRIAKQEIHGGSENSIAWEMIRAELTKNKSERDSNYV